MRTLAGCSRRVQNFFYLSDIIDKTELNYNNHILKSQNMRINRLALAAALTIGCSAQQSEVNSPSAPNIIIPAAPEGEIKDENPADDNGKSQQEPVMEITDLMRYRLYANSECARNSWETCEGEVTRIFFKLTKKVPKHEDRRCMADGDYEPGCMEKVFEQYIGTDPLYIEYERKRKACEQIQKECRAKVEASCDNQCWQEIREETEEIERLIEENRKRMKEY